MSWGRRTGLTLLELLVGLALLATILTALLAATRLGANLLDRSQEMDTEQAIIAARVRLRGWLQTAQPPNLITNLPISFEGTASNFSFVTLSRASFAADAAAIRVNVAIGRDDLSLIVQSLDDDGGVFGELPLELYPSSDFTFSYWDAFADNPDWQTEWAVEGRVPNLVKIEATTNEILDWPTFIVAPALAPRPN